jgi:hypothetical protein
MAITQDQVSDLSGPFYTDNIIPGGHEVVWTVSFDYTGPIDEVWHDVSSSFRWGYSHQLQTALPGPWVADPFGEMPPFALAAEASREADVSIGIVTDGRFWRDIAEDGSVVDQTLPASSQVTVGDTTYDGVTTGDLHPSDRSGIEVLHAPFSYDGPIPVYVGVVDGWEFSGAITIRARILFGVGDVTPVRVMVV